MLVLGLLYCVIVSATFTYDVPLAVWSGKDGYISGDNVGISKDLSSKDVENMLLGYIVKNDEHPEVLVLFAEAQLRSEQLSTYAGSLAKFRNILKTAKSSLQAPYVDMKNAFDVNVINIARIISGEVFYFGKGSPLLNDISRTKEKVVSNRILKVEEILNKHSSIYTDGKTDIVIIYLSNSERSAAKFTETDNIISQVHNLISSHTDNYLCAYTALAYDNPEFNIEFASTGPEEKKRFILQNTTNNTNGTVPVFRQYFGGWFWELFITLMLLVPLLIIGTYAIDSIQTPILEPEKADDKKNH